MTLIDEAKKIYADSVRLYKKSILLNRYSKQVHKHYKKTKKPHPEHSPNLTKTHKEYEALLKYNKPSKKIKNSN